MKTPSGLGPHIIPVCISCCIDGYRTHSNGCMRINVKDKNLAADPAPMQLE